MDTNYKEKFIPLENEPNICWFSTICRKRKLQKDDELRKVS